MKLFVEPFARVVKGKAKRGDFGGVRSVATHVCVLCMGFNAALDYGLLIGLIAAMAALSGAVLLFKQIQFL